MSLAHTGRSKKYHILGSLSKSKRCQLIYLPLVDAGLKAEIELIKRLPMW